MKRKILKTRCAPNDDEEENSDSDSECDVTRLKNSVYFYCDVNNKSVLQLITALDAASTDALANSYYPTEARVYLYIHSRGGDAYSGLSAMDKIRLNPVPVITIADGYVASAATFMLLGADERKALKSAKLLIHQLSTGFWGKYSDLVDEMANSKELMETLRNVYKHRTQIPAKLLDELLSKELHISADNALVNGIVDEVW